MSSVLGVLASLQTALPCARSCRESSSKTEVKALSFRHVYVSTIVATFLLILQIISTFGATGFTSSLYVVQLRLCRHLSREKIHNRYTIVPAPLGIEH